MCTNIVKMQNIKIIKKFKKYSKECISKLYRLLKTYAFLSTVHKAHTKVMSISLTPV